MSQSSEGLRERLSHMSPRVEMAVVLRNLKQWDREAEHLPPEQRLLFLAEALRDRNFFSSFQECLEMATLWVHSDLREHADPALLWDAARALSGGEATSRGLGAAVSPLTRGNEAPRPSEERAELIRGLIRLVIHQIESACGWSERELVSVERDGIVQILELLRLLRAEPEFFEYALETLHELLDRLEAERRAHLQRVRREAQASLEQSSDREGAQRDIPMENP